MTAAEYFAMDAASDVKHELVEGVPYAMAGGTPTHAQLMAAIGVVVGVQLRGTPCRPFSSELRIALKYDTFAYPDYTIICGEPETLVDESNTVTNPRVVFEVLSPSTEHYDRGRKAFLYQDILSLQTLVLVSGNAVTVETLERQSDGSWTIRRYEGWDKVVPLPSIGASLALAELYEGIKFPA
jgi:Uma2 family endonuclease